MRKCKKGTQDYAQRLTLNVHNTHTGRMSSSILEFFFVPVDKNLWSKTTLCIIFIEKQNQIALDCHSWLHALSLTRNLLNIFFICDFLMLSLQLLMTFFRSTRKISSSCAIKIRKVVTKRMREKKEIFMLRQAWVKKVKNFYGESAEAKFCWKRHSIVNEN